MSDCKSCGGEGREKALNKEGALCPDCNGTGCESVEATRQALLRVESELSPLIRQKALLTQRLTDLLSPFKVLDVIEYETMRGGKTRRARVTRVVPKSMGLQCWLVRRVMEDGTLSVHTTKVYGFQNPKKVN